MSISDTKPAVEFFGWGKFDYKKNLDDIKNNKDPEQFEPSSLPEEIRSHIWFLFEKLTIAEIVRKKYRFSGDTHQRNDHGCPIFLVNGKKVYYPNSMRAWGAVMADAWNEIEQSNNYDYMDFYMENFLDKENKPILPVVGKDIDELGKNLD